jgi:hypothetical protein
MSDPLEGLEEVKESDPLTGLDQVWVPEIEAQKTFDPLQGLKSAPYATEPRLEGLPVLATEQDLETKDKDPGFWDYMKMIPALMPHLTTGFQGRMGEGLARHLEESLPFLADKVEAEARAETLQRGGRAVFASLAGAVPTDRGKRFAEDYITEITRFAGSPFELYGTLMADLGFENDWDDFGQAISEMGANPLDVFREKGADFGEEDFGDKLNQGIASTLGFVAAGAKAKAMGMSKRAIAGVIATLGAAVGGQAGRQEAEAFNATPEQIKAAYYFNGLFGLTEAVPVMKAFDRLDKALGGMLSKRIQRDVAKIGIAGIKGAMEEAIQEGFQTIGGDIVAMESYDPTRTWNSNLKDAVQVGGSVGFLMSVLAAGLGVRTHRGKTRKLKAGLGEEALKLTGAKDLSEIAFGREGYEGETPGVVAITTLSDEYLNLQAQLADINNFIAARAQAFEEEGLIPPTPSAVTEFEERTGEAIPRVNINKLQNIAQRSYGDVQLFGGGVQAEPEFFKKLKTFIGIKAEGVDELSYNLVDSLEKKDITSAMTVNLSHDIALRDQYRGHLENHQARVKELEAIPPDAKNREILAELVQKRQQIETAKKKISVIQARITEAQNLNRSVLRIAKKVQKLFPKGTKFLFHDDTSVEYINNQTVDGSRKAYETSSGSAQIFSIPADRSNPTAEGGSIKIQGTFLKLDQVIDMAARIKQAKLDGKTEQEIEPIRRVYEQQKQALYDTLFHELGHHLSFTIFGELRTKVMNGTATTREKQWWRALQADYARSVNEGLRSPIRRMLSKLHPVPRIQSELARVLGVPWTMVKPDLDTEFAGDALNEILETRPAGEHYTAANIDYMFNFEEYMAEEIAKAAIMGKVPGATRSDVDPYFKDVAKQLQKLKAQQPGVASMTSDALGRWLLARSIRGKMALAIKKMQDKGADTINPLRPLMGQPELMNPETAIQRLEEVDVFNKFMDVGFNLLQIAEQNPHINGLQDYIEHMRGWKNEVNGKLTIAQDTITDWERLGKKEQELVGRILLDETVGITYDGKTFKEPKNFTEAEVAQYGLSEEALAVRAKVKANLRSALDEMERVLKAQVSSMFLQDPLRQAQELKKISDEFNAMRKRPYFPLMRFGEYTMVVRAQQPVTLDGQSYKEGEMVDFQAFDTERERNAAVRKLRAQGKPLVVAESYMKQPNFSIQGMPLTMVEHLERTLGNTLSEEQKKMFDQVKKDVLPFKSFKKQYTRRRKVQGYSMDAIRSYANYMTSYANHIGRVKFDSKFQQALKDVDDSVSVMNRLGKDSTKRVQIYNYMNDHLEYVLNPVNEFTAIRSAAFFWFLGFNVKSAFVNATQIPLVTYPYLGAKYGDVKAIKELTQANGTAIKSLTEIGKIDENLAKMIERGLAESWLDESLATELAMAASEKNLDKSLPRHWTQRTWQNISHYGSLPFHTVEKLNRHITAIAAYRLATKEGRTHEEAILDARKAVEKTQFEYARWARPRFMRGKVGGTIFVFMNYMQNAMYFALGGDPGAFRMWLMLFALAGLQGLPFAEDIMDLVDGAMTFGKRKLGMKDPWTDVRTDLRRTFKEMGADPDLILHGLSSSTFGLANIGEFMGWPIPDLDLSASLSLGRITPGASLASPKNRDFDRFIAEMTEGIGGAAVSGGLGVVKSIFDNNPDTWKRWEKAMPAAMRQVSKAARIGMRGEEATKAGWPIAALDWHDHKDRMEVVAQGLGFTPREVSKGWEGYIAVQSAVTYYETRKTSLLRDWNYYKMNRDDEGVKETNRKIREYNRMVPDPAMKIGPDARERSFETYVRQHAFNARRIEQSARSYRYASSIQKVYEDAEDNE